MDTFKLKLDKTLKVKCYAWYNFLVQANELRKGKVWRQDIPVSESIYGGMTRTELSQAQEKELQLTQQDIKMEQTKEKKNFLESYVYETRSKVMLKVKT